MMAESPRQVSFITCLMDSTTTSGLHRHSPHSCCPISEHYIPYWVYVCVCVCVCVRERECGVHGALCQIYGPADSPHLREEWGDGSNGEKSAMRKGNEGTKEERSERMWGYFPHSFPVKQ